MERGPSCGSCKLVVSTMHRPHFLNVLGRHKAVLNDEVEYEAGTLVSDSLDTRPQFVGYIELWHP